MTCRFKDCQNARQQAQANRQALPSEEECALVKWIESLSCTGHPVQHPIIRELANEIRKPYLEFEGSVFNQLGKDWISRFIAHHPSSFQSKVAKPIKTARKDVTENQLQN